MKIAIAVHGRFHAFELGLALVAKGHEVTLFTNYPRRIVERFGFSSLSTRRFVAHGVAMRLANQFAWGARSPAVETFLHRWFGRWVARQLSAGIWDVTYSFSGISEEWLTQANAAGTVKLLVRGSAHIRAQAQLLREEEERTGVPQDRPSEWRVAREEREYAKADAVVVLSSFSRRTFLDEGFQEDRVRLMVSGVRVEAFRPPADVIQARVDRIRAGRPLRILNVGAVSYRKGLWDLAEMARLLDPARFQFRYVGTVLPEAIPLMNSMRSRIEFIPRLPQNQLPRQYEWGDLFVFPTIEDGFPTVCAQAAASGLPVLTTPSGAGTDLVQPRETGWILPIRDAGAFVQRIQDCDRDREGLAAMVRRLYDTFQPRGWDLVAEDFLRICGEIRKQRQIHSMGTV